MKFIFLFAVLFLSISSFAQREEAKEIVKTLTSKDFKGRGYVGKGDSIAAIYLSEKFSELGLLAFKKAPKFIQRFNLSVNTIPNICAVKIGEQELVLGEDYLPKANSGSFSGRVNGEWLTKDNLSEMSRKLTIERQVPDMLIIDTKGVLDKDSLRAFQGVAEFMADTIPVIILKEDKLMHTISTTSLKKPILEIKRDLVTKSVPIQIDVKNEFIPRYTSQNIIGYIEGVKQDEYLCISAHYDHLGMITENVVFPGANDNASGVAMLLSLAKYFSENKPKYSIVFMLFGGEEAGILGSKYYTENPLFSMNKIKFLVNCDISGTGDEGITVVNGTIHKKEFKKLVKINAKEELLSKVKVRGRAANSDHFWFTRRQVPSFFIYTMGGIAAYHDIYDKSETLPLTEFNDYRSLLIAFLESF